MHVHNMNRAHDHQHLYSYIHVPANISVAMSEYVNAGTESKYDKWAWLTKNHFVAFMGLSKHLHMEANWIILSLIALVPGTCCSCWNMHRCICAFVTICY